MMNAYTVGIVFGSITGAIMVTAVHLGWNGWHTGTIILLLLGVGAFVGAIIEG
jgi:hypothetical protein